MWEWIPDFLSIGTFSSTFANKTGLSPREYKMQGENLYGLTKKYEDEPDAENDYISKQTEETTANHYHVSLLYPEGYAASITFVGLFNSPIPNHSPVVGTALTRTASHFFTRIPDGRYYLLACSIEKTINPLRYFVLNDCLRGREKTLLRFPEDSEQSFTVQLREPLPEDPPILINLPKLLADSVKLRNP